MDESRPTEEVHRGTGDLDRLSSGEIEIVVPQTVSPEQWVASLRDGLRDLGFGRD